MSSLDSPQYKNFVVVTSIVSWSVLFVGFIVCLTWYTSSGKGHVSNNQQSEDKMSAINDAMISAMGTKWPVVLLVIVIFIAVCLGALYVASKNNNLNITLSDQSADRFNLIFLVFTIIFSILMVLLAIKEWRTYQQRQDDGDTPNYKPTIEQNKKTQQMMTIVGLGLFVLFGGGFVVWYIFFRNKNPQQS